MYPSFIVCLKLWQATMLIEKEQKYEPFVLFQVPENKCTSSICSYCWEKAVSLHTLKQRQMDGP